MVQATWRLETGNGTSDVWHKLNNPGGIIRGGEYVRYPTKEDGMRDLEILLRKYVEEFRYDFSAIRTKYCGSHCGQEDIDKFVQIYKEEIEGIIYDK